MSKAEGRLQPQSIEMEKAILGAIMLERDAYDRAAGMIQAKMFYHDTHKEIFRAFKRLNEKSHPIDLNTTIEELKSMGKLEGVGGAYYVHQLTNYVVSSANMTHHCRIVIEKFVAREVIRVSSELISEAFEGMVDSFALLERAESSLSEINESFSFGDMTHISTIVVEAMKQIHENMMAQDTINGVTGVPSGFYELDRATRGFQKGDLVYIGARPSVGKTAFALNVVMNAAAALQAKGESVAVWSLEMKAVRLVLRMLSAKSGEWLSRIQIGKLTDDQMKNIFEKAVKVLANLNIFFDDTSGLTLQKMRSKARKLKKTEKLGMIVVDYLQLMTPEERSGNREQEISKISRGLKLLAQELNIPIIALSQLSREVEKRVGVKKPQLSDLRESGSIEQDADLVMFIWAPDESQVIEDESLRGVRFVKIAKQRDGVLIETKLNFKDEIQLFENIEKTFPTGNWKPVQDVKNPYYD